MDDSSPPYCAIAIAVSHSVTVSIAAEISGTDNETFEEIAFSRQCRAAISLNIVFKDTSSKVSAAGIALLSNESTMRMILPGLLPWHALTFG